jgi:hypothetical protein
VIPVVVIPVVVIPVVAVAVPVAAPTRSHSIPGSPAAVLVAVWLLVVAVRLIVAATIVGFSAVTHADTGDGASADQRQGRQHQPSNPT